MQEILKEYAHTEHGIVLKLTNLNLLLPDIMVEEIFWPSEIKSVSDSPEWFMGYFDWYGLRVPLMSFEKLNGLEGREFIDGKAVAIINGSVNYNHLPYYAVLIEDKTQIVPLKKKSIAPEFGRQTMRAEACWTIVDNESAVIPKVEWIEEHLLAYVLNR